MVTKHIRILGANSLYGHPDTTRKIPKFSSHAQRPLTRDRPPYYWPAERWNDWPRQQCRKIRKAFGFPASGDVGALSTVVRALKEETEKAIGFSITSAAASVPYFPAIYDDDMYDLFEYVGLEYAQLIRYSYRGPLLTYAPVTALAGHGFGVCPNITHPQECWKRDDGFWNEYYYVVEYTRSSLLAYHTLTYSDGVYGTIVDEEHSLDLGSEAQSGGPDGEDYWDEVREVLLAPLLRRTYRMPSRITIVGESAHDPAFRDHLQIVLEDFFKDGVPPIYDEDPVYVQAKGAAELVRRSAYLPRPARPEMEGSISETDPKGRFEKALGTQKVLEL